MKNKRGVAIVAIIIWITVGLIAVAGGTYYRYRVENSKDKHEFVGLEALLLEERNGPVSTQFTQCVLKPGEGYCFMSAKKGREECVSFEANCLMLRAGESRDIADCDKIGSGKVDSAFKGLCYGHFAGFKKDLSLCNAFPNKDKCYTGYFSETNDTSVCKLIEERVERDSCYGFGAIQNGDRAMCDLVTSPGFRATCIGIVDSAISNPVDPNSEFASWQTERSVFGVDVPVKFQYPPDWFTVGMGAAGFADGINRTFVVNFKSFDYEQPLRAGDYRIAITDFRKILSSNGIDMEIRTLAELKQKIWEGGSGDTLVDFQGNPLTVVAQKEHSVNGFPAFDLEVRGSGKAETSKSTYLLDGKGDVLVLTREGDATAEKEYFTKILSTFKFLE